MLDSDQMWDALEAEYQLMNFDLVSENVATETQHFWFAKKGEWARVEISGNNSIIFVRNSSSISRENKSKNIYIQESISDTFRYNGFDPRQTLLENPSAVTLHPFGKALPTGYYELLFPTGIAQSLIINQAVGLENIKIVGEEVVAGRKTIIISRMPKNHLYWVDAETGIILRAQLFGDAYHWQIQFEAQKIIYGENIPEAIFQFVPSKDSRNVTPLEYQE